MSSRFITDVGIVSSKDKCPHGYFMVSVTVNGNDADLFEGSLVKRGERYLCFARNPGSNTVITDLNIVKEKDPIPRDFTAITSCKNDAGEKALRKHKLCFKAGSIQTVQSGVVEIVAIQQSKGETIAQNFYTISNDVNGLNICYQTAPYQTSWRQSPYGTHANMPYRPPNIQPSYPAPPNPGVPYPVHSHHGGYPTIPGPSTYQKTRPMQNTTRQQSAPKLISAIQGVEFQVGPKFELLWKQSNLSLKSARTCSIDDIEKKYGYTFETERNLLSSR